jgi:hypothetical protein
MLEGMSKQLATLDDKKQGNKYGGGLKSDAPITVCGLVSVDGDIAARPTPLIHH